MTSMRATEALLANNRRYAAAFDGRGKPALPARSAVVLTCMDARLHPERFLGLELGDGNVIRNAGGRASDDALRSLIISTQVLGTRECLVVHHTDCGLLGLSNEALRARLEEVTGADASRIDFLPFAELDESVREDVRRVRRCPLLPTDLVVSGFVYDVDTGGLSPVPDVAA
jgi:carbonic anhydrase